MSPHRERTTQSLQVLIVIGGGLPIFECSMNQDDRHTKKKADHSGAQDDQHSIWERAHIRRNGFIHDLDARPLPGFIKLGELKLPGQYFEDRFVVLDLSKTADIFETRSRYYALGNDDSDI